MSRSAVSLICALAFAGQIPMAWAQQPWSDDNWPHMMWQSGWMFVGPLMMFALIAVIVLIVVAVLRSLGYRKSGGAENSAIRILDERYARGEIDKEEYEERKQILAQ